MGNQATTLAAHKDLRGEHLELLEGQASFERPTRGAGMAAGDVGLSTRLVARMGSSRSRHGLHRVGIRLLLGGSRRHADHQGRILRMPDGSFQTCRN
jgi:hypothetical protein